MTQSAAIRNKKSRDNLAKNGILIKQIRIHADDWPALTDYISHLRARRTPGTNQEPEPAADVQGEPIPADVEEYADQLIRHLPKTCTDKVIKPIRRELVKMIHQLQSEFTSAVKAEVRKRTAMEREQLAKDRTRLVQAEDKLKEYEDRLKKQKTSILTVMTYDDFKLILGCLHPDKHSTEGEAVHARYNKATEIFKRLKASVHPLESIEVLRAWGWEGIAPAYKRRKRKAAP